MAHIEQKEAYSEKARKLKNDPEETSSVIEGVLGPGKEFQKTDHSISTGMFFQMNDKWNSVTRRSMGGKPYVDLPLNKNKALDQNVFYFINIYSHGEMPAMCEQRFIPCEIGCVRYSLRDGVLGSYHDFIDPGAIPRGFRFHCQAGSDTTHQIPISGFELANGDYYKMFLQLCSFVCSTPNSWASVYTKENDIYRVNWCLRWLAKKAGVENHFEVHDVESLIIEMYKSKLQEEPSRTSVCRLLDAVVWDYADNTRCKWHEENDMWYCALASCKKIAYCISKALASVYGVTLTAAHLPVYEIPSSQNPKVVVLDAKRFQKVCSSDPKLFNYSGAAGNVSGQFSMDPKGVQPYKGPPGGGRGILRLLQNLATSQNSSG
ncbi:hypothetical protein GDO86_002639 [Hymenochirus boettgeri]|uniref:Maelstrom domain-containing protein n=1 Tax=Hymenochirus boettgeri TaxID=247094 RepID=A0A8T2K162_9PIPI|nr:hypothetical protein GDO86_002639 [Hymenochirus boettgeri]